MNLDERNRLLQLEKWVDGESTHFETEEIPMTSGITTDEFYSTEVKNKSLQICCPDFSCCDPDLLWDKEKRKLFLDAHQSNTKLEEEMIVDGLRSLAIKLGCPVTGVKDISDVSSMDSISQTD